MRQLDEVTTPRLHGAREGRARSRVLAPFVAMFKGSEGDPCSHVWVIESLETRRSHLGLTGAELFGNMGMALRYLQGWFIPSFPTELLKPGGRLEASGRSRASFGGLETQQPRAEQTMRARQCGFGYASSCSSGSWCCWQWEHGPLEDVFLFKPMVSGPICGPC